MIDREKVIKGLKCCLTLDSPCGDCPYYSYEDIQELECERNLRNDALVLLKEQEVKEQLSDAVHETAKQFRRTIVRCKDCKYWKQIIYDTPKWMPCMSVQTSGNWFCADGEPKDS